MNYSIMNSRVQAVTALAIVFFFLSCGGEQEEAKNEDAQEIQPQVAASPSAIPVLRKQDLNLQQVESSNVSNYGSITGRVVPRNTTQLIAEVQGRIIEGTKPFKPGVSYREGEVLIAIDAEEYRLNLEAQKSAFLNILTGMMPDLKADYPDNYELWLNYVRSYQPGLTLPSLPETQSESEKYFITSNQVYSTYFSIKAQEERLDKYTVKAPFSGSLSSALIDRGGLINPGQPLGTYISDNDYEIEAGASLQLASKLRIGQRIQFQSSELGKTFIATVTRINNIVDPGTQNIPVYLSVDDPLLKSGMYLEGKVKIDDFSNAVTIDKSLLTRDENVHVLEKQTIKKKGVQILFTKADSLVVAGLSEGDQLITKVFDQPVAGLKITE